MKIESCMDYMFYLLHHSTQNITRVSPEMNTIYPTIPIVIMVPFETNSFHLPSLHEDPNTIQTKVTNILRSYSKDVDKDEL